MTPKKIDAVQMMRELRDRLSRDMEGMTPEERLRYIAERASTTSLWQLFARAEDEQSKPAPVTGDT